MCVIFGLSLYIARAETALLGTGMI